MYDNRNETKGALFCALLMASVLALALILPASASALRAAQAEHPPVHRSIAFEIEDGKVSDHDGIIGNSLRGADARISAAKRAHMADKHRHAANHTNGNHRGMRGVLKGAAHDAKQAADEVVRGTKDMLGRAGEAARDAADKAEDALTPDDTPADDPATPNGDTPGAQDDALTVPSPDTQAEAGSTGVIGWVIAILVILAIALVVLAVLPKKNRSRG